ncbi:MAG: carbon storage regulator CsrA [Gemmatimonadetes bacterium]|nr:carbon storage regulator CsrA [Gemmatimonadota bacterium]
MLILTRQAGEAITIGDGVKVVVLGVDRRGVRIGIDAPSHVRILRAEIVNEVEAENRRAAETPTEWGTLVPIAPVAARRTKAG